MLAFFLQANAGASLLLFKAILEALRTAEVKMAPTKDWKRKDL